MARDRSDPRDTFSPSARRYLLSADHRSGPDLEFLRQVVSQLSPAVTVDVATGAGHALKALYPFSGYCLALDLTLEMLRTARKHLVKAGLLNVGFIQSAADRLPLADGTVSLLTCRIAPHHFTSVKAFLVEVYRVLGPEGRCVIIDSVAPEDRECDLFINKIERERDPSHVRSHTLSQWLDLFEKAGLEVISVRLFERRHPFRSWAARTGLAEDGIRALERGFVSAAPHVRERFKVRLDGEGSMESYTDEKGIFFLKKGKD